MIRILLTVLALTIALPVVAKDAKPVQHKDVKKEAVDNHFLAAILECAHGQANLPDLAEKRSSRQEVKDLAKKLRKEHRLLIKDLGRAVNGRKIAIVLGASKENKARYAALKKLDGKDFDARFLKEVVAEHERGIALCENQIHNGKDLEVTNLAKVSVRILREYLQLAKKVQAA